MPYMLFYFANWTICIVSPFRLRNLGGIYIYLLDDEKRPSRLTSTVIQKTKSLTCILPEILQHTSFLHSL